MKHRKLTSPLEIKDFTQISGTLPDPLVLVYHYCLLQIDV